MRLRELTTEQKTELKETMLEDILGRALRGVTYRTQTNSSVMNNWKWNTEK